MRRKGGIAQGIGVEDGEGYEAEVGQHEQVMVPGLEPDLILKVVSQQADNGKDGNQAVIIEHLRKRRQERQQAADRQQGIEPPREGAPETLPFFGDQGVADVGGGALPIGLSGCGGRRYCVHFNTERIKQRDWARRLSSIGLI